MLNTIFLRLRTPDIQKVKITDTVWYVANCCCMCFHANRLQNMIEFGTKNFCESPLSKYVVNFALTAHNWKNEKVDSLHVTAINL